MKSGNDRANEKIAMLFEKHIGHRIYFNHGEAQVSAILERVTIQKKDVILWARHGKDAFCEQYYTNQAKFCTCGEGKP